MKVVSLNKDIARYNFTQEMEFKKPDFEGDKIALCIGLQEKDGTWIDVYTPGDSREEKIALADKMLKDKSLIILEDTVTQIVNGDFVKRVMYYLPYYVEGHTAYAPTITNERVEYSMNIKQVITYEILLVEEFGVNRYITETYTTGPTFGCGRATNLYEMMTSLEETLNEIAHDKTRKEITIADKTTDDYSKGQYLITYYDKIGTPYQYGYNNISQILQCVNSIRMVGYDYQIVEPQKENTDTE